MSNHRNIAVLSHHQPIGARTGTFIPSDVAEQLVQRMAAEKISAKVIRMLSPESVFLPAVISVSPGTRLISAKLPPSGDIAGTRFRQPSDPAWQELHARATRSLRTRAFMTLKAWTTITKMDQISA